MSQPAEEIRYLKNQQRLQDARDAANPARKRNRYTTVFVGPSFAMRVKESSAKRKIYNASPIYETTHDHVRPPKTDGIAVNAEEVDDWIDNLETEYGALLDGAVDSHEHGFLDARNFSDIAPKGLETKRKLFEKQTAGAETEESVAGSRSTDAVVTVRRKAEDIESPFRDKRAYKAMRASISVRWKEKWRIEAETWLERFPQIPTGLSQIQDGFEQMAISSKHSPPTLSQRSTVAPETQDNEDEDAETDDGGSKDDSDDLLDQLFSRTEKKVPPGEEAGRWVWRSSRHPTLGFVREKIWLMASDWS